MKISSIKLNNLLAWVILGVLALLPLHAFLSTWVGSNFGSLDLWRAWKEFVIVGLFIGVIIMLAQDVKLRARFFESKLIKLILLFCFLAMLRTAYGYQAGILTDQAMLFGIGAGLRYLAFFVVVWTVAQKTDLLRKLWAKAIMIPAAIVIIFGLLQQFLLDRSFLSHFGYSRSTIPPFQTVDLKEDFVRAQSLLRGPNPLGIYLSFIITLLVSQFYRVKKSRFWNGWALGSAIILLACTFSRSGWISAFMSVGVWALISLPKIHLKKLLIIGVAGLVVVGASIFMLRENDFVQNAVFHTDESSRSSQSSNELRANSLTSGLKDVWQNPLGQGLGSAGPASVRGYKVKIAENYYIQIAQETGLIGLFMYLSITIIVGLELFRRRKAALSAILFASLIGISFANMVSHAWMDDTISLIWWGLAAIAIADSAILKGVRNEKTKSQSKKLAR